MPQAPDYLGEELDDSSAIIEIATNFKISRGGVIYPKVATYKATDKESRAINYLILEWDYAFVSKNPQQN